MASFHSNGGEFLFSSIETEAGNGQSAGEQLVVVRPEVLDDAEHALGNLFQRMHHVLRVAGEGMGPYAARLNESLLDLEQLLELLFDYVSPMRAEPRSTSCTSVAESIMAQVGHRKPEEWTLGRFPDVQVLADGRILSRALQLLGQALSREIGAARLHLDIDERKLSDRVEFAIRLDVPPAVGRLATADLAWVVAARLIELQGGELRRTSLADPACRSLLLPS